jgi:hypothetical protein
MTLGDICTAALCILWVLVCGVRWWITARENRGQRIFFAVAAGLGAAMFWILGQWLWPIILPAPETPEVKSGAEIRILPR